MSKYVLLTAYEHNGGLIHIGMGNWLSTRWKVYSDGSFEMLQEYDEMKFCFEGIPQPRRTVKNQGQLDDGVLEELKKCISSHKAFPKRGYGCDMDWWEITIFASNNQVLDSYKGMVSPKETDETLKGICKVLPNQRSALL